MQHFQYVIKHLIFGGIQCMLIGMLGEYLGRVFLTVSGKPQSFVRFIEELDWAEDLSR